MPTAIGQEFPIRVKGLELPDAMRATDNDGGEAELI
jgi:hypothetical protein